MFLLRRLLRFNRQEPRRSHSLILASAAILLGCGAITVAVLMLTMSNHDGLQADSLLGTVHTCDHFASHAEATQHFADLDKSSVSAIVLDSNRNGIPCEGMVQPARHLHDEFDVVCNDFQHRDEAEHFFNEYDAPGQNLYGLDRDLDGRPCETVPPLDDTNRVLSRLNRMWRAEAGLDTDADCGDFETWAEANAFFIRNGGPNSDPHRLDGDSNGVPCESLPGVPRSNDP